MNRAFVKDPDDAGLPENLPERPQSPHPNYVTPFGLRQLQQRVAEVVVHRDRLVAEGKLANPQELAVAQRDLRFFEERLRRAVPVDPDGKPLDRVRFGVTVEVADPDGAIETYTLVGEEVIWRRPAGSKRLEIVEIRRGNCD